MFQFLVAIRAGICVQEIAEFNTTVGTFEFIHDGYLVKVSGFSGLFSSFDAPLGAVSPIGDAPTTRD